MLRYYRVATEAPVRNAIDVSGDRSCCCNRGGRGIREHRLVLGSQFPGIDLHAGIVDAGEVPGPGEVAWGGRR